MLADQKLRLDSALFENFTEGFHNRVIVTRHRLDIKLAPLTCISLAPCGSAEAGWFVQGSPSGFIYEGGGTSYLAETIFVTEVHYKRMCEVTDEEAEKNDFKDVHHMFESLQQFYPHLAWEDEMTFIHFEQQCDWFGSAETDED